MKKIILLLLLSFGVLFAQEKKQVLVIGDAQSSAPFSYVYQTFDTTYVNITMQASPGKTSGWALSILQMDTTKYYDLVIVFVGLNDVYQHVNKHQIVRYYDGIISLAKTKTRNIIAITLPYVRNQEFNQDYYMALRYVNEYILNAYEVTPIDINDVLENYVGAGSLFLEDGVHFNVQGHTLLKELIIDELLRD